jgi:hypothetical protein
VDVEDDVAYGYQYIPNAAREEWRARDAERRANGGSRLHSLDRTAAAIAEAIAEVYRDIAELRNTVPELTSVQPDHEQPAEAEAIV